MTETGLSLGTPHYMSPEQATAEKELTNRSDIYSLGCVLLEMLTGQLPFAGSSARESMQRRLDEPPPDIRALRPDVPEELASVLKRAMKIDPAERYMSASQMADELTSALDLLPVTR